ncbi:MAG: PSD1 and planctomycete cytochrome C domain-containing protein [Planctomycetota bacterium]
MRKRVTVAAGKSTNNKLTAALWLWAAATLAWGAAHSIAIHPGSDAASSWFSLNLQHTAHAQPPSKDAPAAIDFDRDIAPLLARRCLECHDANEKKGGLDLTRRATALQGGESGTPALSDKPLDGTLWQRVSADEMPPKKPLAANEKQLLERWLTGGARWGTDPINPVRYSSERRGGSDWWALQPLQRVAAPTPVASNPAAPRSPSSIAASRGTVDAFIRATLQTKSLTPSVEADRRVLARRLSFDLIGLPPTPELVDEFLADAAPDAYERLVDRLLASPHYGERWARHWLDVAHFGESDGFEYDRLRPNAWPYRDWVIRAFNEDLSYDEFIALQVAGDLLRPNDPQAIIATGFLVGGAFDGLTPAGETMRQIMRQDELEDLVGIVGQSFVGLTVQCARCHDHKFDAITQQDYYRLASALSGVRRGERPLPVANEQSQSLDEQITRLTQRQRELDDRARRAVLTRRQKQPVAQRPLAPQPLAAWEFTKSLQDQVGTLHATLQGAAKREAVGLILDGQDAYAATPTLPQNLTEKTLIAVAQLSNLTQRGGGLISVQTTDGGLFDAIVFGEQNPAHWMAGSNGFSRTQFFQGTEELQAKERPVHVAITYHKNGQITGYVDGRPYGKPYQTSLQTYEASKTQVVFGLRHSPVGGNRMLAGTLLRAALYDRALAAEEIAAAAAHQSDYVTEAELLAELSETERGERAAIGPQLTAIRDQLERRRTGKVFAITPQNAPVTHVLRRGNPLQPADAVSAGALSSLIGLSADFALPPDAPEAQRRQRLAQWLAHPDNALTARTLANRLWHYHFGAGLVPTPNDLGFSGGPPSHPELLDWLAAELRVGGQSIKHLQRILVTSSTFRQSSAPRAEATAVDADNRWLWRMPTRRLEAELVRDAVLAVAGQLNQQMNGPGYQDFRPFLRGGTQFYEPLDPEGPAYQRRSIYRTWARGGHNQLLDTFDCPDPSMSTPRRSVTTTPLQALSLLNNSFILRMSDAFASDLQRASGTASAASGGEAKPVATEPLVTELFRRAWGRSPREDERKLAVEFAELHGLPALCRVILNSNAFVYVE